MPIDKNLLDPEACFPPEKGAVSGSVSREGILVGQDSQGMALVRTVRAEACGSCRAKAFCGVEVSKEAESFPVLPQGRLKAGLDQGLYGPGTPLLLKQSLNQAGWAAFWGFGFPLFLFLASLALVLHFTGDEVHAALAAFASLPLSYGFIRLLGARLFRKYEFTADLAQEYS